MVGAFQLPSRPPFQPVHELACCCCCCWTLTRPAPPRCRWVRWRAAKPPVEITIILAVAYLSYYVAQSPAQVSARSVLCCPAITSAHSPPLLRPWPRFCHPPACRPPPPPSFCHPPPRPACLQGSGVISVVVFGLWGNFTSKWGMLASTEESGAFDACERRGGGWGGGSRCP